MAKTVYKPWGREEWLELNDKYCYKRIYINAGTKTSYQYHNYKKETNYIIKGEAEIWLENDEGVVEKILMKEGDFFNVYPPKKHRVIAITDIILQEVSTPEVDDVIRIEDDTSRPDGKIEHEHTRPAVCILTAGIGKRMGELCSHTNKGLLPLDNKALISHIIDKSPKDHEVVIALGHKGDMVKEYCRAAHSDRDFIFVEVDNYKGEGSGPAYSISKCKEYLQRPFVWVVADAIIKDELPSLDSDWLGVYPTNIPELYSTVEVRDSIATNFTNKGPKGYDHAFIGVAGVYDYKTFWDQIDISTGEIVSAYYDISKYNKIKAKKFNWYDAGTIDNYIKATQAFENYSIPKTNGEFLYKVKDNFIKLCSDESFISGRIKRAENLRGLCPDINYAGKNLYSYKWKDGETLYDLDSTLKWNEFLSFAKDNMWSPTSNSPDNFKDICKKFYLDKTMSRLDLFLSSRDKSFCGEHNINNFHTPPIHDLLPKIDMEMLYDGIPTKLFHGDLQFDNVVYGDDNKFYLIDWRQDFAGSEYGDVNYDLAKMYGGILMSYKLMKDENNFNCDDNGHFSHGSTVNLDSYVNTYEDWIEANNFNLNKIKTLTALIFLNMSPLHEEEFGNLLFFKSKLMLDELLN